MSKEAKPVQLVIANTAPGGAPHLTGTISLPDVTQHTLIKLPLCPSGRGIVTGVFTWKKFDQEKKQDVFELTSTEHL